jgi:hypothetical protein
MNSISFLQTAAQLDSKNIFRRVIDNALSTSTEALLDWRRFEPEFFGIETPRHSPIFAKKLNLPYYALLSEAVQETTLEELARHYADEFGLNFTYITEADEGIISVYIASHEVDHDTLIDLLDDDEALGMPPVDDDDEDDSEAHHDDPEILVGGDVDVNGVLETVKEIVEREGEYFAVLDNESETQIPVADIFEDGDGGYEYVADEEPEEQVSPILADADEDEDDLDDEDDSETPVSPVAVPANDSDDEDDSFEEEDANANADVLVPQIREGEQAPQSENSDDDFPEEELQPSVAESKPEQTEEQALAAAVAEEQAAQEPAPINWEKPPVQPVTAQAPASPVESADDTFAEEPQGETSNVAQNEAQAPEAETAAEAEPAYKVIDDERVSESEFNRRVELLEGVRAELPNDSASELDDGVLNIMIVKDENEYELSVKIVQQMFAGQKMIDVYALSSKDGSVARRASNAAAILDVINSL